MQTLSLPHLSLYPNVTASFTTRHGGVSKEPYADANLAFHVGDNATDVRHNHDLLAQQIGYERSKLVHMRQIHSDRIVVVNESMCFDTPPECDALITDRPYVPLMVMSADCTPILIYDPNRGVIGAVHAGRAGALNGILPKTIRMMEQIYASRSQDVIITLGPSIGGCCYEVNETIANETRTYGYDKALRFESKRVFLDVNTILTMQLEALGIKKERIEVIAECTSCRCDTYFSYRADRQHTGRIAGVIMLRT